MHFLVLGYDGHDEEASARRRAARDAHLEGSARRYEAGRWLDSGALLNDQGRMIGSFVVCDYRSRDALHAEWLDHEPYVVGKVWERVEIHPIYLSPRASSIRP